jgi:hypothetical protein
LIELDDVALNRLAASVRAGEYNLLIGAGVSLGSLGGDGRPLPTGKELTDELCKLKDVRSGTNLQRVFELLNDGEVKSQITDRFSNCKPGPAVLSIPKFPWRRIFTLNVDDALENAYKQGGALQDFTTKNYRDAFEESRELTDVPIIHIHGYAKKPSDGYIFSRSAYVGQITKINSWMAVLADLLAVEPFIIVGTRLDEVDVDFYLAQRSQASSRKDMGPSIFAEPSPDALFLKDCEKHDLRPYRGNAEQFFEFLDREVSDRRPPIELVSEQGKSLFPEKTEPKAIAKFLSDFEVVPRIASENSGDPRFLLGDQPTWCDLQSALDVSREASGSLSKAIETALRVSVGEPQILYFDDETGGGKSTVARRLAFNFARQGTRTLLCSPLGRLEPAFTASMLDLIDDPLLIVVDNFADQVGPVADICHMMEKRDAVFFCSERSYRNRYIKQGLGGSFSTPLDARPLVPREAEALIKNYFQAGWIGESEATENPKRFARKLAGDPIAVACCRILNDFRPIDRIVSSLLDDANSVEKKRYVTAALAQYCIKGGIRYDILVKSAGGYRLSDQMRVDHPLPLTFSEGRVKNYLVPLNGVIGSQALETFARTEDDKLFEIFVDVANAIAPRVNRHTIKRRSPEARLAGRLFDYDQIAEHFLGAKAEKFYSAVQLSWQWNSRYWEQVALLYVAKYFKSPEGPDALGYLETARQHARHAVSIEEHPFSYTTLGKILLIQAQADPGVRQIAFEEAFGRLSQAIDLERSWAWTNTQAFVILFKGVRDLTDLGVRLTSRQAEYLHDCIGYARRKFARDRELQDGIDEVQARLK